MPAHPRLAPGSLSSSNNSNNKNNKSSNNTIVNSTGNSNGNAQKRSSAASVVTPVAPSTVSGTQISKIQQGSQGTVKQSNNDSQQQRNQRPQTSNQKQKPSSNQGQVASDQQGSQSNNGSSSKSKRNQRRKDTEINVDLAKAEAETSTLNQSPPLNPTSPPSTDSDDSESAVHHPVPRPRPAKSANKQSGRSGKGSGQLSASPPQRPRSAPAVPQPRKGMATPQRQQNQQQQQSSGGASGKPNSDSVADLASVATDNQSRPNVSKASSADKVMLADRVLAEKRNNLYAGPTFHNSPAPTCLPIPAFAKSWGNGNIETESSMDTLSSTPFFGEGASPHLNSMRPLRTQSETTGWAAYPSTDELSHLLPDRIVTSNYMADTPMNYGTDQFSDIAQDLRNLLKIQNQ
ncbi:hypothetical protein BGZ65_004483 [Modicella reniformis]|uniref:Uncharacterized protein n=1 Tax=Modicella reniformis TaxID=1440133 RepID=A0A9P6IMC0_9FUNG|nr:hypothetical protein BGZ65_004483 [Modicella reniformis]